MADADLRHSFRKVRRETRRRQLTVASVESLGDAMRRIHFTSDDLADFDSAAPDDHIKLFVPGEPGPDGRPVMRDYTPRRFDRDAGHIVIDFALHGEAAEVGPATAWAMAAAVGGTIEIGGPRGSTIVPDDFDWYLLIGDESAIPAIGRRIEELRPDATIVAVVSLLAGREWPPLPDHAGLTAHWSIRASEADDGAALLDTLGGVTTPAGDGFVWVAAEAAAAKAVRGYILGERGHEPAWFKASGYWLAGEAGAHTKIGGDAPA